MSCMNRPMWKLRWLNCCNLPQNVWHEKATLFCSCSPFIFTGTAFHPFTPPLSLHSDLLSICHRSDTKARTFQRALPAIRRILRCHPLGRFGIWSGSLKSLFSHDWHSLFRRTHHLPQPQTTAIVSCRMDEKTASSYLQAPFISVSLHPWYLTEENIQSQMDWLVQTIQSDSWVVALGETGLDKVCDTLFDLQIQAFRKAIELSKHIISP